MRTRKPGGRALTDDLRAPVQRKVGGGTLVQRELARFGVAPPDPAQVQETAAAGVAGTGGPLPHLDRIQASFGEHDVSGIRAHVGGAAAEAATAIGAEAYATGNDVAFASEPSLHTAAHEAAHVVQQRAGVHLKGGVGEAGDPYEQQADAVADAVVRGEPAAHWLDGMAPSSAARPSVQRKDAAADSVHADDYLTRNRDRFMEAIRAQLAESLPQPHARVTWKVDAAEVANAVLRGIAYVAGQGLWFQNLPALLHPRDPWKLIDGHRTLASTGPEVERPIGPATWSSAAGQALALAVEASMRDSLARMAPRYVVQAEQSYGGRVPLDALVTSHPFDGVVALLLTTYDLVDYAGPTLGSRGKQRREPARAGDFRGGLRMITRYEWLGAEDPRLWNWLRVIDVPDASREEVAMAIFDNLAGEPETYLAYGLTAAPPLFGVPPEWARRIPDAAAHAPDTVADETAPDALAVAGSELADDVALAQASTTTLPAHDASADQALIERGLKQIDLVWERLLPWNLGGLALPAKHWLLRRRDELATGDSTANARWSPVLHEQQRILFEGSGGVVEVLEMAAGAKLDGAHAPEAAPFLEALGAFATAIGESHLVATAQAQLEIARQRRAHLPLALLGLSVAEGRSATNDLAATAGPKDRYGEARRALDGQADLEREHALLQQQALRGEAIDADVVEMVAQQAAEHSFETRIVSLRAKLHLLEQMLRSVNREASDQLLNRFFGTVPELIALVEDISSSLGLALAEGPRGPEPLSVLRGETADPDPRAARALLADRRARLATAQARFGEVAQQHDLSELFSDAVEEVEDAQIRGLIFDIAALIGISIVSAGTASFVAGTVRGSMLANSAVGTARFLASTRRAELVAGGARLGTEAALNATGQTILSGGDFDEAFLENLIADAAVLAALRPLHAATVSWGAMDEAALTAWQRVGHKGKLVLTRGAIVSAEMITAAAVGYVAQRVVHGAPPPGDDTLVQWLVQGASMAAGRFVAGRATAMMERLESAGEQTGDLWRRARQQRQRAARVEKSGDPDAALEMLAEEHALLVEESALLRYLEANADAREHARVDDAQIARLIEGNVEARAQLSGLAFQELPLRLAGLTEVTPGALWSGTSEDIALALHQAQRAGVAVEVLGHDQAARRWEIRLGERTLLIDEVNRSGPPREARGEVTKESAEQAQRYAAASRFLQDQYEAHIKADLESRTVIELDYMQVGNSIAGVINQATLPAGQHMRGRIVVYRDPGTLGDRGDLRLGQKPKAIDAPGMRTSEQTPRHDDYATSRDLGNALDIGRFENQVPAYRGEVVGFEARPDQPSEDWLAPHRAMRVRVRGGDGNERWFYVDKLDYAGGAGPTKWASAKDITSESDFDHLRARGLLLAADDPQLSRKLKPGAERVFIWGGSASGAWAAEDAIRHGAKHADLMGDIVGDGRSQYLAELEAAGGDPAKVAAVTERYLDAGHSGRSIQRNKAPGAAYDNPSIKVELGTPTKLEPSADGRVVVTIGDGERAQVRVYDQVVVAHGQEPAAPHAAPLVLGAPNDASRVRLTAVMDEHGRLIGLESIDPPGIRLIGAAYATPAMLPWVHRRSVEPFREGLKRLARAEDVSADSVGVKGGIETARMTIPTSNSRQER